MNSTINISRERVRDSTNSKSNAAIDQKTEKNINRYSQLSKYDIQDRIIALEKEWDIERTLAFNASIMAFTGVVLSVTTNRKWLILPALVTAVLAQHAIQGWCPPLPLLRKMKVRTRQEIDREKYALMDALKYKY